MSKADQDKAPSTPAEGPDSARVTLSSALGSGMYPAVRAVPLGALPAQPAPPAIPPEIDAELNTRERRITWLMVNGATFEAAYKQTSRLDASQTDARPRDGIPPNIVAAVAAIYRQLAAAAGLNRAWLIEQTVGLFERASSAAPVLDRKGRPTGEFRFDGATAAKCLDMLAQWNGELYPRKAAGLAAGDVVELMRAVAARGRTDLGTFRGRVLEHGEQAKAAEQPRPNAKGRA